MKKFKQIDFLLSCALIIGSVGWGLVTFDERFLIGYFVVGGWQVISMIVHAINGWFCQKGSSRYKYHWAVSIITIVAMLGFVLYPLLIIFFPLLFLSPFMAIWYTSLCYDETYIKMSRPMELLK